MKLSRAIFFEREFRDLTNFSFFFQKSPWTSPLRLHGGSSGTIPASSWRRGVSRIQPEALVFGFTYYIAIQVWKYALTF